MAAPGWAVEAADIAAAVDSAVVQAAVEDSKEPGEQLAGTAGAAAESAAAAGTVVPLAEDIVAAGTEAPLVVDSTVIVLGDVEAEPGIALAPGDIAVGEPEGNKAAAPARAWCAVEPESDWPEPA